MSHPNQDPTPDEIRSRTEAIRRHWTPQEQDRRACLRATPWMPPVFSATELPGSWSDAESSAPSAN